MSDQVESLKISDEVPPISPLTLKIPYYFESFIKTAGEIIKFYSSVHRAYTYSGEWTKDELGENRTHLKLTDRVFWNFNSPKISRREFHEIVKDWETYQEYAQYVLLKNPEEIKRPNLINPEELNDLFIEIVNIIEKDWLFRRSYYKLFYDVSKQSTVLFLDLAAFCSTRYIRFLMKKLFRYLEGNYVTSLRLEGKVYIPHLQFYNESVELLYTSYEGLNLEHVIADYFIKENIKSVEDVLDRFERIANLRVDVAEEATDYIFLNPSKYIKREAYLDMYRKWIMGLAERNIDFQNRESIISNVNIQGLEIPDALFVTDEYVDEDKFNYPSDKKIFFDDLFRAKRWLIRVLFNHFLQYSINRYRFEAKPGPLGIEERTEYENIFRNYKDMSFLEQDVGCLLVECGEISFIILLWRYIENPVVLDTPEKLLYWGLIEKENGKYKFSARAKRMAKWCMKLMGLKYPQDESLINYSDKSKIARSYANLIEGNGLFSWMMKVKDKEKLSQILGEIIFPQKTPFTEREATIHFKKMIRLFYDTQDNKTQKHIREAIDNSRFNKPLNEFLRANETINRAVIAFPVSTIPTEVERKTRTFSIFIGTFNLDERLDNDDEDAFEQNRRDLTDMLNYAKVFYTLVGKPAAESASEAAMRGYARRHLGFTLGRYQHKVKNEGVYLVARMDGLWQEVAEREEYADIRSDILEMKRGVERFSGTIHILNIATNGFQRKYLEPVPYCIIDVIAEAYCNAFQQFYRAGRQEEVNKLWLKETGSFLVPLLNLQIRFEENGNKSEFSKSIYYLPSFEDLKLQAPSSDSTVFSRYFDAEDIIEDSTILGKFSDALPQKIILQSPFFEIFTNAFTYMSKEKDKLEIEVKIIKRLEAKEIVIEVINSLSEEYKIDKETPERVANSAGIAANRMFFENIGSGFVLEFDEVNRKAIARTSINFPEMERIIELKEK